MHNVVLVRYGEIGLKGKNRGEFEAALISNIKRSISDLPNRSIERERGRLFVPLLNEQEEEIISNRLAKVFGIVSFSPATAVAPSLEEIKQASLREVQEAVRRFPLKDTISFKVEAKRADKKFPLTSLDLNRVLGGHILSNVRTLKVEVNKPAVKLSVEVRRDRAYIYVNTLKGPAGLPVGISGQSLLLLSGGIDSPVAGWMAMKRGLLLTAVHYHSPPFTSEKSREKVIDLCKVLSKYQGKVKLVVVPFTEVQTAIHRCPEELWVTLMRRMMLRIAQALALELGIGALVTGESLGQVASQTLESMSVISAVSSMLILRPLIGFDKAEIIELARRIETFDVSIRPYEDCCTLFVPRNPATRPKREKVELAEEDLKVDELVANALAGREELVVESVTP